MYLRRGIRVSPKPSIQAGHRQGRGNKNKTKNLVLQEGPSDTTSETHPTSPFGLGAAQGKERKNRTKNQSSSNDVDLEGGDEKIEANSSGS